MGCVLHYGSYPCFVFTLETSSPKGNDRSPESNMPRSNVVFSKGSDQKPRKGGDIIFPIISQWGLSVAMETRGLIQSAPKPYAAFPPPQWLANWLQRYSSSKVWNFRHSKASHSKMSGLILPKTELNRAFMPIPVTATLMMFQSKMNELAWRQHFPIVYLWEIF